jgi:hypothetical protein
MILSSQIRTLTMQFDFNTIKTLFCFLSEDNEKLYTDLKNLASKTNEDIDLQELVEELDKYLTSAKGL